MRPQDEKGTGGAPEAGKPQDGAASGLPVASATCAVVGCGKRRFIETQFCEADYTAWSVSPECRVGLEGSAAAYRTALADFVRRVAAEALNGRKGP